MKNELKHLRYRATDETVDFVGAKKAIELFRKAQIQRLQNQVNSLQQRVTELENQTRNSKYALRGRNEAREAPLKPRSESQQYNLAKNNSKTGLILRLPKRQAPNERSE